MDCGSKSTDTFTVTFGADVDCDYSLHGDKGTPLKSMEERDSSGEEMDVDSVVQGDSIGSIGGIENSIASSSSLYKSSILHNANGGDKTLKTTITVTTTTSSASTPTPNHNQNLILKLSDVAVVVLSSADVTSWSPTQQDFSELFFLANNANNSHYVDGVIGVCVGVGTEREKKEDIHSIEKDETAMSSGEENDYQEEKGEMNDKSGEGEKGEVERSKEKEKEQEELKKVKEQEKVNEKVDTKGKENIKEIVKAKERRQVVPLLLEMTEPNPETPRGMDLWLVWFDGLKHSSDALQSFL